tara:strand:+ start:184 stop:423 length:240 start_codon:yes stop_codon:yes gene_type:complete
MYLKEKLSKLPESEIDDLIHLHQGACIEIESDEGLFQVIGVDNEQEICWIRKWPLLPKGSPVFEISIKQVSSPSKSKTK